MGADEDIWDGGGDWVQPTAARIHDIVSTSANDDGSPAGTGANTLRILGLDGSYNEISEDITLNGVTNVPTTNSYIMIHQMRVLTAGSTNSNVGTITATAQVDGTITAQINPTENTTQMAIYQVPAGKTGFIVRGYFNINKSGGAATAADIIFQTKPLGEVFSNVLRRGMTTTGSSAVEILTSIPFLISEKSIIKARANVTANNTDASAGFDIILIDN